MQCFDNGSLYTVTVLAREVYDFAVRWPCSHMNRNNPVTFQFDKRNGDLVDSNDADMHPNADGAAIVALSNDAMLYGAKRLKLAHILQFHGCDAAKLNTRPARWNDASMEPDPITE